ncbi:MAG: LacI family DNA-binding transcriptional regulator [Bacillota bacterium]
MGNAGERPRRITIKDVARSAGVSVTTASVALRRTAPVKESTRQRVLEAARRLHYYPNRLAQTLVLQRSTLVGVLVPDIADPYFHEIVKGVEAALSRHGYSVLLCDTDRLPERQAAYLVSLREHQVSAIIVAGAEEQDEAMLRQLQDEGVRIVLVGRTISGIPHVRIRNDQAAALAAEHLLGLGHRRIAFIRGPEGNEAAVMRLEGFRETLQRAGTWDERLVFSGAFDVLSGSAAMGHVLALRARLRPAERPTAVLAANDQMAVGALQTALRAGVRIPDDMAIMGIGGIPLTAQVYPTLSTVALPLRGLGEVVGEQVCRTGEAVLATDLLAEACVPTSACVPGLIPALPIELVPRDSTLSSGC